MAGIEYDYATGLYHTPARYYNPVLQRFLSEDPLDLSGGDVNLFAYSKGDPVNHSDPLGLIFCFYGFTGDLAELGAGYAGNGTRAYAAVSDSAFGSGIAAAAMTAAGAVSGVGSGSAVSGVHLEAGGQVSAPGSEANGLNVPESAGSSEALGVFGVNGAVLPVSQAKAPEYRGAPKGPRLSFPACGGIFAAFTAPTVAACLEFTYFCGSGALPACLPALGACGFEFAGMESCWAQAHGAPFPDLPEGPPGEIEKPGPSGLP